MCLLRVLISVCSFDPEMFHIPLSIVGTKFHGQNKLLISPNPEQVGPVAVLLVGEKELLGVLEPGVEVEYKD